MCRLSYTAQATPQCHQAAVVRELPQSHAAIFVPRPQQAAIRTESQTSDLVLSAIERCNLGGGWRGRRRRGRCRRCIHGLYLQQSVWPSALRRLLPRPLLTLSPLRRSHTATFSSAGPTALSCLALPRPTSTNSAFPFRPLTTPTELSAT